MKEMLYINKVSAEQVGGGNEVDFVHLPNGQVLGINDECVGLYTSMQAFWDNETPLWSQWLKRKEIKGMKNWRLQSTDAPTWEDAMDALADERVWLRETLYNLIGLWEMEAPMTDIENSIHKAKLMLEYTSTKEESDEFKRG
jgi:hypothetical protein